MRKESNFKFVHIFIFNVVIFFHSGEFNPLSPKSALIDFTLSYAIWFNLSKGDPLGPEGLKNHLP